MNTCKLTQTLQTRSSAPGEVISFKPTEADYSDFVDFVKYVLFWVCCLFVFLFFKVKQLIYAVLLQRNISKDSAVLNNCIVVTWSIMRVSKWVSVSKHVGRYITRNVTPPPAAAVHHLEPQPSAGETQSTVSTAYHDTLASSRVTRQADTDWAVRAKQLHRWPPSWLCAVRKHTRKGGGMQY